MVFLRILTIVLLIVVIAYLGYKIWNVISFFNPLISKTAHIFITAAVMIGLFAPAFFLKNGIWVFGLLQVIIFMAVTDLVVWILESKFGVHLSGTVYTAYRCAIPALLVTTGIMIYGVINMKNVVRTEYDIDLAKASDGSEYKIAVIADVHYGLTLNDEELKALADRISAEKADAVVLDGDIVDENTTNEQMHSAFEILGGIKSRYGVFYVYGNHDRAGYADEASFTEEELSNTIEECGITILEDETIELCEGLVLIGRADNHYGKVERKDITELTENLDRQDIWMVLDHQPTEYKQVRNAGADVIVSGHTHAGQIWPLGILTELFTNANDMNYGYRVDGNLHEIVTAGVAGWGFPMRTEEHSEYVILSIK